VTAIPDQQIIASRDGTPLLLRGRRGRGGGAVVLLGHGPSVHSGLMEPLIETLAAAGATVWAGDLRGHGGSVSARAPLAHLDPATGWAGMVEDMTAFARIAFDGVPVARRILVGGGMSGHLMLALLGRDPGLARHLVMAAPTPSQPGVMRLAGVFTRVRALARPVDRPDPQFLHHLYGFLRAQLPAGSTLADTISADPAIVARVLEDPRGFPTPTLGYWQALLPGMQSVWSDLAPGSLPADLRVLLLTGPEDPQMRGGRLGPQVSGWFAARGVPDTRLTLIEGVRANVLIDAPRLPVVPAILDWYAEAGATGTTPPVPVAQLTGPLSQPAASCAPEPAAGIAGSDLPYLPALRALGLSPDAGLPPLPMLIDLCYAALDDDARWIELIYRLVLDSAAGGQDLDGLIEALHPHWQRAFELREELRRAASMGRLYDDLIDRLDLGVAVLDPQGQLRHHNRAWVRALDRLAGPAPAPGDIAARTRALLAGNGAAAGGGSGGGALDERPLRHQGRLVGVSFVPASLRGPDSRAEPAGRMLVLRAAADDPAGLSHRAGLMSLAYGLTGQEGLVALHLAHGKGTAEIAAAMAISEHTVRSHLKQVFDKMAVGSRSELVHRVMAGPLGWLAAEDPAAPRRAAPPGLQS